MSGEALSILQVGRARYRRLYLRGMNVWRAGLMMCLMSAEDIAVKYGDNAVMRELIVKWVHRADELYAGGERPWGEE